MKRFYFFTLIFISCYALSNSQFDEGMKEYDSKNYEKAVYYFEKAAKDGDVKAYTKLGSMYFFGLNGIKRDIVKARDLLIKSSNQNDPEGQYYLSLIYSGFFNAAEQNKHEELEWLEKSALNGYADAQCSLAQKHLYGNGIKKDIKKALEWYERSAENGSEDCMIQLANMYRQGETVEKDLSKAFNIYLKGANNNKAIMMSELGFMYETGQGVERNYKEAAKWYLASQEIKLSLERLGVMHENGVFFEKNLNVAFDYFEKAAGVYSLFAYIKLAKMLKNGEGTEKDSKRAAELLWKTYDSSLEFRNEASKELSKFIDCSSVDTNTRLFDVALGCMNRSDLRIAIKNAGGKPIREDNGFWDDTYDSTSMLLGTHKLSVYYTNNNNQFSRLIYDFAVKGDESFLRIRKMLESKYKKPYFEISCCVTWITDDGLKVGLNIDSNKIISLTYYHAENFKTYLDMIDKKIENQRNNF
ncbi:hypothetical protein WG68_08610 [Arsukibacterium ikkense]|uniref:Uncharacterized protein n=1 Tax=Arsukibacterium ikkense TaxID=336831 RepID=A0A0M2V4J4_9GAMM|nr:SEL1-like repeat protein [Arsukibacterium ikkense]KKO45767.1 hypothetical protein WG68_08610 [Arsukibacterium ikkense]